MQINQEQAAQIQQNLLDWYTYQKRELPWRKDKDPYKIWVSEIMLQQTRVETVIPYFERFMGQFPTIQALAEAEEQQVIKAWEGLGYYSRARNLHSAVKEVVATYGGEVPNDPHQVAKLKGVGPYTTGAIMSIAFDRKWPAVDGNVFRVFSRLFHLTDDIAKPATRKKFEQIANSVIPETHPGDFNQALMELGATICKPTSPTCLICPVRENCAGFATGVQEELPIKSKAKAPKQVSVACLWITDGEHVLLAKRENAGLLAGMWSLPTLEPVSTKTMEQEITQYLQQYAIKPKNKQILGTYEHIFTHRHWKITLHRVQVTDLQLDVELFKWHPIGELDNLAMANVYRKALSFV